ncbi:MAG: hemerythrin domain-containing protein [Myxococcota bacterium]
MTQAHLPPQRIVADQLEATLREHEELMAVVARLEAAATPEGARRLAADLLRALPCHFIEEDKEDGLFDWLAALDPNCRGRLQALASEHAEILRQLDDLIGRESADVLDAARALAERIRRHESAEVTLLREVVAGP